jgi:manganese/zinc/iron transport system ATP- binding protein
VTDAPPGALLGAHSDTAAPLAVRGLTVRYGDLAAVSNVTVGIAPAALTAIVGPNGAGKSTLLKAVLGLLPVQSGEVLFFGQPVANARARIAYVPQRASVDWDFPASARDVVTMGMYPRLGAFGRITKGDRARAMDCLARVGMDALADRQIGRLSGGQQQRVFLARALAQGADLFLLDEPFAGVDAATEAAIVEVLRELRTEGRTVVAVHHDLTTVADYFDRVILMRGRVVADGPVSEVFTDAAVARTYGARLGSAPGGAAPGASAPLAPPLDLGAA